ncbi:hypothetical protein B7C42_07769 [Nocardia cerradoensis]|uniref:IrrE N-terminal-like domain-containing protein n=2 Tax=Nocardia cerradoensis TaxID=85688 RepID=A0A231GUC9_9NOCA|nr:hypothetical protein B7C42_07769 [Nocardia cerradoensis]
MLRRSGRKPAVYHRSLPRGPLHSYRQRFTLAHELGHLKLAWHLGNKACEMPGTGPSENAAVHRYLEEQEADQFASCLLVPDRWLVELISSYGHDMDGMLGAIAVAKVSTTASLLALRRQLSVGWVFQINNQQNLLTSRGTALPGGLADAAQDHGCTELHKNKVRWWRLTAPFAIPPEDQGPRQTPDLLRGAIRSCERDHAEQKRIEQSANGIVGGGANQDAGKPPAEVFAALAYRFQRVDYVPITQHPDFHLWLARKARAVAAKPRRA